MKLSQRGEYAMRALIVLGQNYSDQVVRIHTISQQQNIPHRFLEQILNDLKSGGFVDSKRGIAGGYRLAQPPQNITLASIIRHIEGPIAPVSCVSENYYKRCSCPSEQACAIRSVMKEVRDAIAEILERETIADLCARSVKLQAETVTGTDYVI